MSDYTHSSENKCSQTREVFTSIPGEREILNSKDLLAEQHLHRGSVTLLRGLGASTPAEAPWNASRRSYWQECFTSQVMCDLCCLLFAFLLLNINMIVLTICLECCIWLDIIIVKYICVK